MAEYKAWYQRYPDMFEEECEEMRKRSFSLDQSAFAEKCVTFAGPSSIEPDLIFRVEYPDSFPSKPPRVSTPENWHILPRHHSPHSREICTFGLNQHRWSAHFNGTAAIDEAEHVIRDMLRVNTEQGDRGDLIDDVPEPITVSYNYQSVTSILVPPAIAKIAKTMAVGDTANFHILFKTWPRMTVGRMQPGRGVVSEFRFGKTIVKSEEFFLNMVAGGIDVNGPIVRLNSAPPNFTLATEFNSWLKEIGIDRRDWMVFVFPEQSGTADSERLAWIVFRSRGDKFVEPLRTFIVDDVGGNPRIPKLQALAEKKVVLVGCGSMGSKIAVALAATGVESFGIVDFDFMEPANSVRHELGVESFGIPKPNALQRRLIEANPRVWNKVEVSDLLIGQTKRTGKEELFHGILASASLVIDSTGDHGVSRFLNDLCSELNVPQIYASVTNGAWSGEVIRVIPRRTACWLCWLWEYENQRPSGEPAPGPGVFAPGCDHPTFTGTTYDVGIVANLASSLAVDTLLIEDENRSHFNGDYLRWQLKDANGLFVPKIEVLPIHKRNDCRLCETR
ncbi:MAG TPA: ThiF family adenylyltransferase [Candidatus Angelobacter sp.]